jgi:FKBP-type peptidyl-prolyl cis-trans isomerase FkpA
MADNPLPGYVVMGTLCAIGVCGAIYGKLASAGPSTPASSTTVTAHDQPNAKPAAPALPAAKPEGGGQLKIEDLVVGKGTAAKEGDNIKAHYVGTLMDGKEFDSSKKHGQPFEFKLGAGRVIKGWDKGIVGMKVGGKRKLTIPPDLAYGERGAGGVIPPNATLVFDVELLDVK